MVWNLVLILVFCFVFYFFSPLHSCFWRNKVWALEPKACSFYSGSTNVCLKKKHPTLLLSSLGQEWDGEWEQHGLLRLLWGQKLLIMNCTRHLCDLLCLSGSLWAETGVGGSKQVRNYNTGSYRVTKMCKPCLLIPAGKWYKILMNYTNCLVCKQRYHLKQRSHFWAVLWSQ